MPAAGNLHARQLPLRAWPPRRLHAASIAVSGVASGAYRSALDSLNICQRIRVVARPAP